MREVHQFRLSRRYRHPGHRLRGAYLSCRQRDDCARARDAVSGKYEMSLSTTGLVQLAHCLQSDRHDRRHDPTDSHPPRLDHRWTV